MKPHIKKYFWSAVAGMVTYVLGFAVMNHELHPATAKGILAVISLPLWPAIIVSAAINMKPRKPHIKKYYLRMTGGSVTYALGIFALNYFYDKQSPYRYWLVLLPVLPLIYVSFAAIRFISDTDEMWRKVYTEAMAFSGLATGFTCFSYLFLRGMGAPEFHGEWALYIMGAYFLIGLFFSWRRYK
ncbi:MAG: hypothetical protein ABSE97_05260 [Verrucomicrobiota bacterium]